MSKYNKAILTNAGLELAARASSGKAKFTITRAATSTEKLADKSMSELQEITELPSLMQYGEINNVSDAAQDKKIVIGTELVFNNKNLTASYNVNTIGLFAKEEGTNKEILYALTTAIEPETMPDFKDKVLFKFNMTMFVVVGQTDNVSVNVTDNGVVTQQQLSEAISKLQTAIDNAGVVKTVDGKKPDDKGNIDISSLQNPDGVFTKNDTLDIDTFFKPGIYSLKDPTVIASINPKALDAVPANRDGKTRCGYLIISQHDIYNVSQEIRIFNSNSYTVSHRFLFATNNFRPAFERIATTPDLQNLQSQITTNYQNTMKTWVGTLEQYQSMATHEPMTVYYIISDYEVVVK